MNKSIKSKGRTSSGDGVSDGYPTAASTVSTSRTRQLGRDKLLEEFTTRFVKTRGLLHERNEQCALLANEIPKYKKELIELHDVLQQLERLDNEKREICRQLKDEFEKEQNIRKSLGTEVAKARKDKQERLREKELLEKDYDKSQYQFRKVYDEHMQLEATAKKLSKVLQDLNHERVAYRKKYYEQQELIRNYSRKLESLKDEFNDMKSFVYTSIEALH